MFSLLLPVVGLAITGPELLRLLDARSTAEACLERARTETVVCEPAPDLILLVIAVAFSLVFAARLVFLVYQYFRSGR